MSECVLWLGSVNEQGYGRVYGFGSRRSKRAHVIAWEKVNGCVPHGLQLDHLCRNRACINVEHLEVVTSKENTLRGVGSTAVNARKSRCPLGHPLSVPNLRIDKKGKRTCKTCARARERKYQKRRRAALRAAMDAPHAPFCDPDYLNVCSCWKLALERVRP